MENRTLTDYNKNVLRLNEGEVTLWLKDRDRALMIGRVYTDNDRKILVTLRNSEKHLFRKLDAYGFNYQVLENLGIDFIKLIEDKEYTYMIPVSAINDIGKLDKLNFARVGYELQRFISRHDLQQFRVA